MSWDSFVWFALAASLFWISGAIVSVISKRRLPAAVLTGCGSAIFMTFSVGVWISLGRPPLRTMGETRLWFSLFLSLIGLVVYLRWRYRWVLPFGCLMAVMLPASTYSSQRFTPKNLCRLFAARGSSRTSSSICSPTP